MRALDSILLPGLDGTTELRRRFLAAAPAEFPVQCQDLPSDRPRGYRELTEWVCDRLPRNRLALVAESFSGPLAILVAAQCPQVIAVVLCASFVEGPVPALFALIPSFFWNRPPPSALVSALLTGGDRPLADAVRSALAGVSGAVVAERFVSAVRADVRAELQRLPQPFLFLQAKQDRLVRRVTASRIRALKPTAEFVDMDGPHLLLPARPAEAWTHIKPFLERAAEKHAP